jgi:hypothetical protein
MDIRQPVGLLFMIIGILLIAYGLLGEVSRFAGYNLDVLWGAVMGACGALLWLLSRRAAR